MTSSSRLLELEECLIDKSANPFTSAPEFAELVSLVQRFHELLALTSFGFNDLEIALAQEERGMAQQNGQEMARDGATTSSGQVGAVQQPSQQVGGVQRPSQQVGGVQQPGRQVGAVQQPFQPFGAVQQLRAVQQVEAVQQHSPLIENLLAEILHFFSYRFDSTNIYRKLYSMIGQINRWCVPQFDTRSLLPKMAEEEGQKCQQNGGQKEKPWTNGGFEAEDEESDTSRSQSKLAMSREPSLGATSSSGNGDGGHQQQKQNDVAILGVGAVRQRENDDGNGQNSQASPDANANGTFAVDHKERMAKLQPATSPDYLNLSSEGKLRLLCFLIDAQLACAEDTGHLDGAFPPDQQRVNALAMDGSGRKFWYLGDTWLFMEEGQLLNAEEEEQKAKLFRGAQNADAIAKERGKSGTKKAKKRKKHGKGSKDEAANPSRALVPFVPFWALTQQELDECNAQLFTGHRLRVVCKCSEHFSALIQAYRCQRGPKQQNEELIERLEECRDKVQAIEHERLQKAAELAKRSMSPRQSSRIARILEQRKQVDEQRQRRHAAMLAERKRIEQEQAEFLREHRRLTDSDIQSTMSREERLKQRQQRILDHLEREELIEAGLLTPSSPSTSQTREEEDGTDDDEEDELFENGHQKQKQQRRAMKRTSREFSQNLGGRSGKSGGVKVLKNIAGHGQKQKLNTGPNWASQTPRMGAMDWWPQEAMAQGPTTSSDGTFISLFQRKSAQLAGGGQGFFSGRQQSDGERFHLIRNALHLGGTPTSTTSHLPVHVAQQRPPMQFKWAQVHPETALLAGNGTDGANVAKEDKPESRGVLALDNGEEEEAEEEQEVEEMHGENAIEDEEESAEKEESANAVEEEGSANAVKDEEKLGESASSR